MFLSAFFVTVSRILIISLPFEKGAVERNQQGCIIQYFLTPLAWGYSQWASPQQVLQPISIPAGLQS